MNNKRFLVVMRQRGKGCDYTIGCGTRTSIVYANSKEEAIQGFTLQPESWKEYIDEHCELDDMLYDTYADYVDTDSEVRCNEITLYEISSETNLIPLIKESVDEVRNYLKEVQTKKKEEAEFEHFKKFEKE